MSSCGGCSAARAKVVQGLKTGNTVEVINGITTGVQIIYAKYIGKTQVVDIQNQVPQSANVVDVSGAAQSE
jgi:hypothetical protein